MKIVQEKNDHLIILEKNEQLDNRILEVSTAISISIQYESKLEIPPAIAQFKNLKGITFIGNAPIVFPSEINSLSLLYTLYFKGDMSIDTTPNFGINQSVKLIRLEREQSAELIHFHLFPVLTRVIIKAPNLVDFPMILSQLPKLDTLDLKDCPITNISPEIAQFKNLFQLSLSGTHFKKFPFELMGLISVESFNSYQVQLDFTNFHTKKDLSKLGKIISKATRAKVLDFDSRIVLYHLYFGNESDYVSFNKKCFFDALKLKDSKINDTAISHLHKIHPTSLENRPLKEGAVITVLGKLQHYSTKEFESKLKEEGLVFSPELSEATTHVVLNIGEKKDNNVHERDDVALISELQVKEYLERNKDKFLVKEIENSPETLQNIRSLLHSSDDTNWTLALELMESGGYPKEIINDFFIKYQLLNPYSDEEERKKIAKTCALYLNSADIKALRYISLETNSWSDLSNRKKIRKYLLKSETLDADYIAGFYYQHYKQCYTYLIRDAKPATRLAFLKQHYKDDVLDFSSLKSLNFLPEEIKELKGLTTINLQKCAFERFPANVTKFHKLLPDLKTIDLRNNNEEVYGKSSDILSHCNAKTLKVIETMDVLFGNTES